MSAACCGPLDETGDVREDVPGVEQREAPEPLESVVPWWRDRGVLTPILSGVLLAVGYGLEWTGGGSGLETRALATAATIVLAASLLVGASTFVPGAIRNLVRGRLGVGLLMTIAAVGAVLLGHVGEAAALAFLFSIAEALEDRAMDRARDGLRALLDVLPETARLSKLSGDVIVPAADVRELDILEVRAGERVATDGIVVSGHSSLDTSAVTGESIPVEVGPGDVAPAGSINGGGVIQIEATADGLDNSLTTIVRLVEEAHTRKGARARLADRIARPLVPIVLVVAALVVLFGFLVGDPALWTERALVVLVAASPCALAIAVPVTVISAIGSASRFGVVITSGLAFEQLGAVRRIAFDKTGTLTRNAPEVVAVVVGSGARGSGPSEARVLALAAAVEARSTHPLAAALATAVDRGRSAGSLHASDVVESPGRGVTGVVDGTVVRVGSTRWIDPVGLADAAMRFEEDGMTVVVVETDGETVGVIGIRDELHPEAAEAMRRIRAAGIDVMMLTGDNARTASAIAAQAGIDEVRAECTPADKAQAVEAASRQATTAMIGDGVNDAPALAAASVGIAMGATGSAAAVESAEIVFTGTDLRLLPDALLHARRGRRIMTGNIVLALLIIAALFPLALFGVLGLAGVVLVHEIAEVVVILNGVRAARRKLGSRVG
ncbi:heavy metal translocating P-type ATPase [Plantibacter sp. YIM 135347]|uniref:heavy metal translocating P-type ATPase n=1 Tax=Plantibacter sp. YIM 135347 TaxID=3423919 RepID=UPI003D32E25B